MYSPALHSEKSEIDGQRRTNLFSHGYHEESTHGGALEKQDQRRNEPYRASVE